ncbi:MAG: glycosyltransferase [Clostridiales bacterium]|nr:glycosyltransferase [Clostridiales bacterium]
MLIFQDKIILLELKSSKTGIVSRGAEKLETRERKSGCGNSGPKVSVIIPVYNTEKYLRESLDSILAQTLAEIEIICVDDGSTDGSRSILRDYAARDSRVRCIFHEARNSASQCRKDGVLASVGSYVLFLDADDWVEPETCETAVREMEARQVDLLQFGAVVENCANLSEGRIRSNQNAVTPYMEAPLSGDLLFACIMEKKFSFNLWGKAFRGDLCRKAFSLVEDGSFPKANDLYAMFFLLHLSHSYAGIETPLYHYCFGRGMTGQNVMTLEQFRLHCQSPLVANAIRRYLATLPPEEEQRLLPVWEQIRSNLLGEHFGRWRGNLDTEDQQEALSIIRNAWGMDRTEFLGVLANQNWYRRAEVAQVLTGAPTLQFRRRKIRTIALHYRCIANGGAQRVVAMLCNLFAGQTENGVPKYKVILITDEPACEEDYPLSPLVERCYLPDRVRFPKGDFTLRARAWEEILNTHDIDVVVNSQWIDSTNFWDMLCVKSHPSHPAYCVHCHNCFGMIYRLQNRIVLETSRTFAMADSLIVLSHCDQRYWWHFTPRVYQINNPCHISAADSARSNGVGHNILWVGRLSQEKQPMEIVQIMRHVLRQVPDAICTVVGSGDDFQTSALAAAAEDPDMAGHLRLEGFQTDVAQYYQQASVFLMTSTFEGFCLSLTESAAFGLPAVTYDLPWLEYYSLIQGWTSVPQLDASAAADAIVRLLTDRDYWQQQSDLTYNSFPAYEQQDFYAPWAALFRDLEEGVCPDVPGPDPSEDQLLYQITRFHDQGMSISANQVNRVKADISHLNGRMNVIRDQRDRRDQKIARLTSEVTARDIEIGHLNGRMNVIRDQRDRRDQKIARLTSEVTARDIEIGHLNGRMNVIRDQRDRRDQKIARLTAEVSALKKQQKKLRCSRSYRLGRALTAPLRAMRRLWRKIRKKKEQK